MRKIWTLARTDMRIGFSERSTLLYFFILPAVFMVVLSFAFDTGGGTVRYPLIFVDESHSAYSALVRDHLEQAGMEIMSAGSREEGRRLFDAGKAPMMVVLPADLEERMRVGGPIEVGVRLDQRDNRVIAMRETLKSALSVTLEMASVARAGLGLAQRAGVTLDENALVRDIGEGLAHPPLAVDTEVVGQRAAPKLLNASQQSAAGQLVTWGLITFLAASSVLLHERDAGTLARLFSTPTSRGTILAGKLFSRYLLGMTQMLLLVLFGWAVLGVDWGRSPVALMLVLLSFGLMGVSLGVALATVVRTAQAASALSTFLSIVLAALGGAWWPLEITPSLYRQVARIFPTTWAMKAFEAIFLHGAGAAEVLPEVGILLAYALVFALLGVWRFRQVTRV